MSNNPFDYLKKERSEKQKAMELAQKADREREEILNQRIAQTEKSMQIAISTYRGLAMDLLEELNQAAFGGSLTLKEHARAVTYPEEYGAHEFKGGRWVLEDWITRDYYNEFQRHTETVLHPLVSIELECNSSGNPTRFICTRSDRSWKEASAQASLSREALLKAFMENLYPPGSLKL